MMHFTAPSCSSFGPAQFSVKHYPFWRKANNAGSACSQKRLWHYHSKPISKQLSVGKEGQMGLNKPTGVKLARDSCMALARSRRSGNGAWLSAAHNGKRHVDFIANSIGPRHTGKRARAATCQQMQSLESYSDEARVSAWHTYSGKNLQQGLSRTFTLFRSRPSQSLWQGTFGGLWEALIHRIAQPCCGSDHLLS